ncbi:hypothetical protein AVEN_210264-1 [Araneus ventricosus]|uniref:Uncharacterized protein n=1 Tax=Araneus ventricosus TaxID=182803 RepID=A0A4Y2HYY8_ARAVE|nr:hypothetical protein AVEN_210264-1 [Araneus ventricosus]
MAQTKIGLLLLMLAVIGDVISSDESNTSSVNTTEQSSRSGRKNNIYYSPPDDHNLKKKLQPVPEVPSYNDENLQSESDSEKKPLFPPPSYDKYPSFYKPKPKYVPEDSSMHKSGSNVNWNVWKGDSSESSEFEPPAPDMKGVPLPPNFPSFYPPAPWKDNSWDKEKMAAMIMMMKDLQEVKPKPSNSFLSKLKTDPSTLLLVSAIPISILLAAVLPSLMNNMIPTPAVSTTATGNRGRMLFGSDFFAPILDGVSTFGHRALENPGCMQRIFCQVTKGSSASDTSPRILQRALHTASAFVDESYLDSYGVKDLFDSMSDGNCEKVPCTNFNLTDYVLKYFYKEKKE